MAENSFSQMFENFICSKEKKGCDFSSIYTTYLDTVVSFSLTRESVSGVWIKKCKYQTWEHNYVLSGCRFCVTYIYVLRKNLKSGPWLDKSIALDNQGLTSFAWNCQLWSERIILSWYDDLKFLCSVMKYHPQVFQRLIFCNIEKLKVEAWG